jgi:pyruvate carboxylase
VQILGDAHGNLVHLWERDCSVQRRHQKVVEVAPSINLPDDCGTHLRGGGRLCRSVATAAPAPWSSCSTRSRRVLLHRGQPAIQVEHTVTEMITGIDLVRSQLLVASGHRLHEPPSHSRAGRIDRRGVAMQCRSRPRIPIAFHPDYGRITTYRSAGGFAVRLDGGNGSAERSSRRISIRCW